MAGLSESDDDTIYYTSEASESDDDDITYYISEASESDDNAFEELSFETMFGTG